MKRIVKKRNKKYIHIRNKKKNLIVFLKKKKFKTGI